MTPAPAFAILEGANQPRSEAVSDHEILPLGHHEFIQRVQETLFEPLDTSGFLVRLYALVEAHPSEPPGPGRHRAATTLAIRMDQAAARRLCRQIHETFQRMDWPLRLEDERQA
jgi:hypothetical protein